MAPPGSLRIGYSKLEEEWFHQLASRARNVPCEFDIISKERARELHSFMNFDNARIIVSPPNDGHVDPSSVAMYLAQLAKSGGQHQPLQPRAGYQCPAEWRVGGRKREGYGDRATRGQRRL